MFENAYLRTRKFVADHKVAIAVVATAAVAVAISRVALNQHNDFLKENGLYEQFYAIED
jgi:hypothetical protein